MSSTRQVRKLNFQFDETLAFQSNPGNPAAGNLINALSIVGPSFEKYFIRAFRQAIPSLTDPLLRAEAEWFCAQEAQHSRHHLSHVHALYLQYPGLKHTLDAVMASYMQLLESESLEYHLAYTAIVELSFGPTAKFIIDQRQPLLGQCDKRAASLVLWHFVEEFEHRNCAIDMYNALVGSYWFRLKCLPSVARHLAHVGTLALEGFKQHVPPEANPFGHDNFSGLTQGISTRDIASFLYHLTLSQMPLHRPDRLRTPDWAEQWFRDEQAGIDMTLYFP